MKTLRRTVWRAYDTQNKKWLDHNEMFQRGILLRADGVWGNVDQHIIPVQFTGRYDVQKKPIFEGDICEVDVPVEFGEFQSFTKYHAVLVWSDPHMGFVANVMRPNREDEPPTEMPAIVSFKIVGTIMEDQHLLKEMPKV